MLPLLNHLVYCNIFGDIENEYPAAKWINKNGFYIGCHHGLNEKDLDYIAKTFESFMSGIKNNDL